MLDLSFTAASMLGEIQHHFLSRSFNMSSVKDILLIVGAVIGVLGLGMLVLHFRPKRAYVPHDWITDNKAVRRLLQGAIEQRGKFELQFASDNDTRRPALRASGVDIEGNNLVLEASGLTTLSEQWAGRSIDCFFMITRREGNLFYAFTATISSINVIREMCFIRLHLPDRIETRQKRSYLRIAPPAEYMLGAAIWRGLELPDDAIRNDISAWPKPSLVMLPAVREDFCIRDISSGGLRIHLPRHILAGEMDYVHVSTQFLLMLDLWDPDKSTRLRYWMLCRMQSPVLDFETKGMDLGVQFLAWAKPKDPGSSELLWLRLGSSGEVEPVGNWIMRRHLEDFRELDPLSGIEIKKD